ncbi:MAG: DUF1934 family protein, partial [Anaerovoracaceae bacterium]
MILGSIIQNIMTDIMMKITGSEIIKGNKQQQVEFVTEGKMLCEKDSLTLSYEESPLSGTPGFTTEMTMMGNKFFLSRKNTYTGELVEPKLSMEKGERHEGIVETPF